MGKLTDRELMKLLACIKKDARVIVPPTLGFDSGVHSIDERRSLVVSTDPCAGVPENWFGWLLINYAASDVALFGAKPEFCALNLLGTPLTQFKTFERAMKQACKAADELGIAIVTGHTGTYQGLSTMVGVCTAYGIIDRSKLITPAGAKPNDHILITKPIGMEIAINLALTQKSLAHKLFGPKRVIKLRELVNMQSCVKEALCLAEAQVHAMHDATEGGLIASLNEMAEVSSVGFTIHREKIQISPEVIELQRYFHLSDKETLSMSSTGTIVAAASPETSDRVVLTLGKMGLKAKVIGVFTKERRKNLIENGKQIEFPQSFNDPYERILSGRL